MAKKTILDDLVELGRKIKHQSDLLEKKPEIKEGLEKSIHEYVDTAINHIRNKHMMFDPLGIIYGEGFEEGHPCQKMVESYLVKLISEDDSGEIVAITMHSQCRKKDFVGMMKNGVVVVYNKAKKTLTLMKQGLTYCVELVKATFNMILEKIKNFFKMVKAKFKGKEKNEPVASVQSEGEAATASVC